MAADRQTGEIRETFTTTLRELRGGVALLDLSEALADLVVAVRGSGMKGALLLKITVAPASKGADNNTLILEDEVIVKRPKAPRGATILFSDENNILSRRDPRQPSLQMLAQVEPLPFAALRESIIGKEAASGSE